MKQGEQHPVTQSVDKYKGEIRLLRVDLFKEQPAHATQADWASDSPKDVLLVVNQLTARLPNSGSVITAIQSRRLKPFRLILQPNFSCAVLLNRSRMTACLPFCPREPIMEVYYVQSLIDFPISSKRPSHLLTPLLHEYTLLSTRTFVASFVLDAMMNHCLYFSTACSQRPQAVAPSIMEWLHQQGSFSCFWGILERLISHSTYTNTIKAWRCSRIKLTRKEEHRTTMIFQVL